MEQTTSNTNEKETQKKPARLWQIVRVMPISVMALVSAGILAMFLMGGVRRITAWYLLQSILPVLGAISLIVLILYAIVKRKFSRLFKITSFVTLIALLPIVIWFGLVAYPASLESTTPTATVRLPADVPLKVVWGGDSVKTNYHAIAPDQRWAYDLLVEPYITGSDKPEDYGCYGVPVVAPISGLVSRAHDGEPDATPGVLSNNFEAPLGNHVVIKMETETYLIIAHMKPGSIMVKTGDIVEEGQQIGECGNSGNTSEPHIHIHHQRQDPAEFPINFAEGLPLYFRDHDGAPMPLGGIKIEGDSVTATGDTVKHIGK